MLAIGDLAWVPFVYSLQARYLVINPIELGYARAGAIVALNLLGYWIFRASNGEKNDFRNGKNPKSKLANVLVNIPNLSCHSRLDLHCNDVWVEAPCRRLVGTFQASQLSVRASIIFLHLRYTEIPVCSGDLLMALAWSLPTGFNTPVTYFYVIYFTILLIHRQRRDDENCEKKYACLMNV